ncbi:hypothetical protein V8E55_001050 [Tylopilus felleus]
MRLCMGCPCDQEGNFLPPGTLPSQDDWDLFHSWLEFELADFLYSHSQMPAAKIDSLLDIWVASLLHSGGDPLFNNHKEIYGAIDDIKIGDIKWRNFMVQYTGDTYQVHYRDPHEVVCSIVTNPDFATELDYSLYREYVTETNDRRWCDFMSGDWAWNQADIITQDAHTHGSVFVLIILGSDKTTVSVATGQNDFFPLYMSIGNVCNRLHRAHKNALVIIGFLAMLKTMKAQAKTSEFWIFCRQLFHSSLAAILKSLKSGMTNHEVLCFGDGHFRRVIYGLGPYIADYEEQVLLSCIVNRCMAPRQELDTDTLYRHHDHTETLLWDEYGLVGQLVPLTNDFPCANIYGLISPDLLHQIIKGAFKDHLVDWVENYIRFTYSAEADAILNNINQRIAAVAPFSGLRCFPQGRHFKQWMGNDSKALMKVYLPAIEGYVPQDMVRTFRTFLKFCYLVRRDIITDTMLTMIQESLEHFHHYRSIFSDVMATFSLPRQHAMKRYPNMICLFSTLNGLCLSITESKHIKAVKEPYHYKLARCRTDFQNQQMLKGSCTSFVIRMLGDDRNDPEAAEDPDDVEDSAPMDIHTCWFLFRVTHHNDPRDPNDVPLEECPYLDGKDGPRHDYAFVYSQPGRPGMCGLDVIHILTFFTFGHYTKEYPCVVMHKYTISNEADEDTGMWVVQPAYNTRWQPDLTIIHLNTLYRTAHLIPIYGNRPISTEIQADNSYNSFHAFYINKYVDHHTYV